MGVGAGGTASARLRLGAIRRAGSRPASTGRTAIGRCLRSSTLTYGFPAAFFEGSTDLMLPVSETRSRA